MITSVQNQLNYKFVVLSTYLVNRINIIEGNSVGNSVLAQLLDQALAGADEISQNVTAAVLTGFSSGAGAVSATDTILTGFNKVTGNVTGNTSSIAALQNGTPTFAPETVTTAGALSTTLGESIVANASGSTYAVTLAAPSAQDGQMKVIKMTTATHTVTLAMTNIKMSGGYTPTGTTTLTFTNAGDCAVLMAVGAKWIYLGGSAVAS